MSERMSSITYPITVPAIRVVQPLGVFYVVALPARVLLDTAYSDRLRAKRIHGGQSYELQGAQRELLTPRLREIGAYISTEESTFPNSIILAPNFDPESGQQEDDANIRWRVDECESADAPGGKFFILTIPSPAALAPIIDGQHRLFGFNYCDRSERLDEQLVCSIFIDLPKPFQAFLFATINSNQRPVNKSQTYDLFGYNIEKEPPESWSPDKLAVFLARKLNSEEDSALRGRILIAADNDFAMSRSEAKRQGLWMVSMAVVVEGISRLVSQNAKRDRTALLRLPAGERKREMLSSESPSDKAPLRQLYLESNDKVVFAAVKNFFSAADKIFWSRCKSESFICRTVGIQALFDTLTELCREGLQKKTFSIQFFEERLSRAGDIDFSGRFFQNASGSGRQTIRTCLLLRLGFRTPDELPEEAKAPILEALNGHWSTRLD